MANKIIDEKLKQAEKIIDEMCSKIRREQIEDENNLENELGVEPEGDIDDIMNDFEDEILDEQVAPEIPGEGGYQQFFRTMLDKYGVTSPQQLDPEKRKEFFAAIDAGWKGKKETD
jgi:hypothetical protein